VKPVALESEGEAWVYLQALPEAAARLEPDSPLTHFNLGFALSRMPGRLDDAIAEYSAAVRIAPDFADAYRNLGNALMKAGRTADAAAAHRELQRLQAR